MNNYVQFDTRHNVSIAQRSSSVVSSFTICGLNLYKQWLNISNVMHFKVNVQHLDAREIEQLLCARV